jgi:sterol desaturase/sphingolipid hydroxylase (fatty acid hydroxylase superfamily)
MVKHVSPNEKIFIIVSALFLAMIGVSLIFLVYALMDIDAIYNIKDGSIEYRIGEMVRLSMRIMFSLVAFVIIFLVAITIFLVAVMVVGGGKTW